MVRRATAANQFRRVSDLFGASSVLTTLVTAEAENGGFASTASRLVLMRWGLSGSRARGRVRSTLAASYFCFESARAARFGKHASQFIFHEANLRQSTDTAPASIRIEEIGRASCRERVWR